MVGPDAYGEALPVGELEDRPALVVGLNIGDAAVDGHRVLGLGPMGQALVQLGLVVGCGAVAELAPAHRGLLARAAHLELGDHVGVVVVLLQEATMTTVLLIRGGSSGRTVEMLLPNASPLSSGALSMTGVVVPIWLRSSGSTRCSSSPSMTATP
ncbi:hypothetical protein [Streptomyces sp. NPDC056938]|uniref:hypothetical protein n=1 Tax=Streptomyces sp. NPDC056938 TaxID=3345970 RepID=UPI00362A824D